MVNLSEIVFSEVDSLRRNLPKNVSLEVDLMPVLPDMYSHDDEWNILSGLINLIQEMRQHANPQKVRIAVSVRPRVQVVEVAWGGKPLDEIHLCLINNRYMYGANSVEFPRTSGTMIAGFYLKRVGATVRMENFNDQDYRVRNIIEFPFDYRIKE